MKIPALLFLCLSAFATAAFPQNLGFERERHVSILRSIKEDIRKNYYDPQFRGIDLDAHFKKAEEGIQKAESIGKMSGIIAQTLVNFDDSHLFFVPPGKVNKTNYGFEMQMVGDACYITRVNEKSDAFKKGLQIGDQILDIEKFTPGRKDLWLMNYYFRALRPQAKIELGIRKPDGKESVVKIDAMIANGKQIMNLADSTIDINNYIRQSEDAYTEARKQFIYDQEKQFMIWQMPAFSITPADIDSVMDKAKDKEALVIDLRNNGGGRVDTLKRLTGWFFEQDVKIGDEKTRKETKEMIAKSKGKDYYKGKLVVLVDSESGSAAEIFAKVIQLQNRGKVLGDVSAGAVMESRYFPHQLGLDVVIFYGASVTIADLIMTDGKSLEKIGVIPDEKLLPTAQDIAEKRDPVLSRAVKSLGFEMSSEQAGALFAKQKESFRNKY
jgi:C-terminal processing protease CtpA/Prc